MVSAKLEIWSKSYENPEEKSYSFCFVFSPSIFYSPAMY